MTHPGDARLHDYVDDLLEPDAAREVAGHLESCGRCRERVEAIRELTARLGDLPREIPPRRDLRPDLPDGARAGSAPGGTAGAGRDAGAWLRAAAVVAAMAGAGALVWLGVLRQEAPRASRATAPDPVVATYAEAAGELATEIRRRRSELSPAATRALEASLASVDASIRELERARERVPVEEELTRRLAARYRTKLEILRGVVRWLETS